MFNCQQENNTNSVVESQSIAAKMFENRGTYCQIYEKLIDS